VDIRSDAASNAAEPQSSELPSKRELFSPTRTLGFSALQSRGFDPTFENQILESRRVLTSYEGVKGDVLERYLNGMAPLMLTSSIKFQEELRGTKLSWKQWLHNYATNDEIQALLSEHGDVLKMHANSEGIAKDIDALQMQFTRTIAYYDDIGSFGMTPEDSNTVPIMYGDIFDTILQERGGYYESGLNEIVLAQGYTGGISSYVDEARRELPRVLTHEWVHALVSRSYAVPTSSFRYRWVNEAITETISKQIRKQACEQDVEDNVYIEERTLLGGLLRPAKNGPQIRKMMVKAYAGDAEHRDDFEQAMDSMWGSRNVLRKVSIAVVDEEARLQKEGIMSGRTLERVAVQAVIARLTHDSRVILHHDVEAVQEEMQAAAQEPKK
jgi:hypothetical protein